MLELIIGGARSGKSAYAQQLAADSQRQVIYIATASADDSEMLSRITMHKQQRPTAWETCEEPLHLAATLRRYRDKRYFIIVDCLTLWLSNLLTTVPKETRHELELFYDCLPDLDADCVFVSNEVGMGIVPLGELSRRFVDEAGWLHQSLAKSCQRVTHMIAGIPNVIKNSTD